MTHPLKSLIVLLAMLLGLVAAPPAQAAFAGANGKIAFTQVDEATFSGTTISVIDPDGTDLQPLTSIGFLDRMPAWSPDGTRIAFASNRHDPSDYDIYVMNQDGSGIVRVTGSSSFEADPAWSPDGSRIVFTSARNATEDCGGTPCGSDLYVVRADGSGLSRLTSRPGHESDPAWSPDGTRIAEIQSCKVPILEADTGNQISGGGGGCSHSVDWSPDGKRLLTAQSHENDGTFYTLFVDGSMLFESEEAPIDGPAWSPDGTKVAFGWGATLSVYSGGQATEIACCDTYEPDWQPLPVNTEALYVRPKAARVMRLSLVPAYKPCTGGPLAHGPPFAYTSCKPPRQQSGSLQVSVAETRLRSSGALRMRVTAGAPGAPDDTDVHLNFGLTNVMNTVDYSEYSGELRVRIGTRVTDLDGPASSTTQQFRLSWNVPCTPTADPAMASSCALDTTLDAVLPGAAPEGTGAIWEVDDLIVNDGGPDGDADTSADNTPFMTQGIFVP